MAAAPNAGLGLLNLGGCGILLPSSHPNPGRGHGFLVPRRSISVSPLSWGLVRGGGRVVEAGVAGSGGAGALASAGEAGAGSSELRHIEKELTFSPTFSEYVKIMESVKLDRSNKILQGGDSDGRSARKRFAADGEASVVRRADRESGDLRDRSFERRRGAQRDRGSDNGRGVKFVKNDTRNNVTGLAEKRMLSDVEDSIERQGKVEEYVQRRIVRGELSKIGDSVDNSDRKQFASYMKTRDNRGNMVAHQSVGSKYAESNARKDLQRRADSIVSRTSVPPDRSIVLKNTKSMVNKGKEDFTSTRSNMQKQDFNYPRERKFSNSEVNVDSKLQRYRQRLESSGRDPVVGRLRENAMDCNKPTVSKRCGHMQTVSEHYGHPNDSLKRGKPEAIRMQRGGHVQMGKFARRDVKAAVSDDRAAFKTFEVFTDIRNRPRVLQMEMEERIQKLASRLNATDVITPEWKFSKMIHEAQIKFTDHSILRTVQILGRYGNWKLVLQVVEWLQSRERFKSYKSRYIYTTVLDVLGKAKRPFEALNVFYTMLDQLS